MIKNISRRAFGATAAAAMAATAAIVGAGAADAQETPPLTLTDPWGRGEAPMTFGTHSECLRPGEGDPDGTREFVALYTGDARPAPISVSSTDFLPTHMTMDVDWTNHDTGESGTMHTRGYAYHVEALFQPGAGHVTGNARVSVSALDIPPESLGGVISDSVDIPFDRDVAPCS